MDKKDVICPHGYHIAIRCFQCEFEFRKKLASEKKTKEALDRICEAAKKLDW